MKSTKYRPQLSDPITIQLDGREPVETTVTHVFHQYVFAGGFHRFHVEDDRIGPREWCSRTTTFTVPEQEQS